MHVLVILCLRFLSIISFFAVFGAITRSGFLTTTSEKADCKLKKLRQTRVENTCIIFYCGGADGQNSYYLNAFQIESVLKTNSTSYKIDNSHDGVFGVASESGKVFQLKPLDFEKHNAYNLEFNVVDQNGKKVGT